MIYKIINKNNSRLVTAKLENKYSIIIDKYKLYEIYLPLIITENKRSIKMIKCNFETKENCLMNFSLPIHFENIAYIEALIKIAENVFDNINRS